MDVTETNSLALIDGGLTNGKWTIVAVDGEIVPS